MLAPRVLVLRAPGTNCDYETARGFERAGAIAKRVHVHALAEKPSLADDYQILCIPGGFSYGDDIASGRIFAVELRTRLADVLMRFRDRGGLVLGICNGFQVLLQTGLLLADAAGERQATLTHNTSGRFIDRWVRLRCEPGPCVFLEGLADLAPLAAAGQLPLRYAADAGGQSTNPNGSAADVAGACDPSGRVFGLMPHPERFIEATQHPAWHGRLDPDAPGTGLAMFINAIRAVS